MYLISTFLSDGVLALLQIIIQATNYRISVSFFDTTDINSKYNAINKLFSLVLQYDTSQ